MENIIDITSTINYLRSLRRMHFKWYREYTKTAIKALHKSNESQWRLYNTMASEEYRTYRTITIIIEEINFERRIQSKQQERAKQ